MNEQTIKEKLRVSINHLSNRKLTFEIKTFPIRRTIYEIFSIYSKKLKKKLGEALEELKTRKNNCDGCSKKIDTFNPSLSYDLDINETTFSIRKIEVYCSKCHMIKNFTLFSHELYQNIDASEFFNFSPIYEHYYSVNNLKAHQKNIFENDINHFFAASLLAKNLRWKYTTPHETFEKFLDESLMMSTHDTEEKIVNKEKEDSSKKRKTEEIILTHDIKNVKKKKKS
ncbi:hypothetical protein POVWA2_005310 [Plasmodium ovale wallikeri]|uniref:Uncharacterized protein n=2 Tax=Plasmodium ovale TaxID=36330 RepID=A0A1A8YHP3_PLAOA|nr:hypothetical protein POVWA1_005230 [Plasmodium ovale wallikeri]SBT31667.1 hypothetical protein POVWA2_005310 [Plasmodium ovale wallikeri]SBT75427.1 conserved Plasmodium protein, unknown function [Plasmodium ovale]